MLETVSLVVVVMLAGYFFTLAFISIFRPEIAKTFLLGFATSPFKHYLELALRLIAGASLVAYSTKMAFSQVFTVAGWLLIATTTVLIFVPQFLHRRFAEKTVPEAVKYLPLIAISSAAIGAFIIYSIAAS